MRIIVLVVTRNLSGMVNIIARAVTATSRKLVIALNAMLNLRNYKRVVPLATFAIVVMN